MWGNKLKKFDRFKLMDELNKYKINTWSTSEG